MGCILLVRSLGGVFVDVVISEQATASMEIPDHPVERGAKISDHAWRVPTKLTMSCAASASPVLTYQAIFEVMKRAEPFDVVTGFAIFENMMIESLAPARECDSGQILKFEATLKEVIIVDTQVSASANGGDERGEGETNRGEVQARDVDTSKGQGEYWLGRMESL